MCSLSVLLLCRKLLLQEFSFCSFDPSTESCVSEDPKGLKEAGLFCTISEGVHVVASEGSPAGGRAAGSCEAPRCAV